MRQIMIAVVLVAMAGIVGCSSKPKPTVVDASIEAARDANPDRNGRPSPVVIYLYELESSQEFGSADFFALTDAGGAGAPGVLNRREFQLDPGDRMRFNEEVSPDARYLGVVAAYRDIQQARWRHSTSLLEATVNELEISIDQLTVSIRRPN